MQAVSHDVRACETLAQRLFGLCREITSPYKALTDSLRKLRNILGEVDAAFDAQPGDKLLTTEELKVSERVAKCAEALQTLESAVTSPLHISLAETGQTAVSVFKTSLDDVTDGLIEAFDHLNRSGIINIRFDSNPSSPAQSNSRYNAHSSISARTVPRSPALLSSASSAAQEDAHTDDGSLESGVAPLRAFNRDREDRKQARRAASKQAAWLSPFASPDPMSMPFEDAHRLIMADDGESSDEDIKTTAPVELPDDAIDRDPPLVTEKVKRTDSVMPTESQMSEDVDSRVAQTQEEVAAPQSVEISVKTEMVLDHLDHVPVEIVEVTDEVSEQHSDESPPIDASDEALMADSVSDVQAAEGETSTAEYQQTEVIPEPTQAKIDPPSLHIATNVTDQGEHQDIESDDKESAASSAASITEHVSNAINEDADGEAPHSDAIATPQSSPSQTSPIAEEQTTPLKEDEFSVTAHSPRPTRPPPPPPRVLSRSRIRPTTRPSRYRIVNGPPTSSPTDSEVTDDLYNTSRPTSPTQARLSEDDGQREIEVAPVPDRLRASSAVSNDSTLVPEISIDSVDEALDTEHDAELSRSRVSSITSLGQHSSTSIPPVSSATDQGSDPAKSTASGLKTERGKFGKMLRKSWSTAAPALNSFAQESSLAMKRLPLFTTKSSPSTVKVTDKTRPPPVNAGAALLPVLDDVTDRRRSYDSSRPTGLRRKPVPAKTASAQDKASVDLTSSADPTHQDCASAQPGSMFALTEQQRPPGESVPDKKTSQPIMEYYSNSTDEAVDTDNRVDHVDFMNSTLISQIVVSWNLRRWPEALRYLTEFRNILKQTEDRDRIRRVNHLLGVYHSYHGDFNTALERFLEVLCAPVGDVSYLDDGDCAASWWAGDIYALQSRTRSAFLAYSIAQQSSIFQDFSNPDLFQSVEAERECVTRGIFNYASPSEILRAEIPQQANSICTPTIITQDAVYQCQAKNHRQRSGRSSFQLNLDRRRIDDLNALSRNRSAPPPPSHNFINISSATFDSLSPWPLPYDPFISLANVRAGRLTSHLTECDLLTTLTGPNPPAKIHRSIGKIDDFATPDVESLILSVRHALSSLPECEWAEVLDANGEPLFKARVTATAEREALVTVWYFSVTLFKHVIRNGYGAILETGSFGSARVIADDASDTVRGVPSSEITRLKKAFRTLLDDGVATQTQKTQSSVSSTSEDESSAPPPLPERPIV